MQSCNYISKAVQTALILSLLKLYTFRSYAGAVVSYTSFEKMSRIQEINNHPICKVQLNAFHLVEDWVFKTQKNLANMNGTTFNSL